MRSVTVKELKDDVGRYLDEVLAGEEVVIKDRNKPVAKILPFSANGEIAARGAKPAAKKKARKPLPPLEEDPLYITDEELAAHEARMIAEGRMRPPIAPLPPEFWEEPLADFGDVDLVRFISEDRASR
ncbi:MAG: type II toxin-antitoxin system Phd/YefM family antitoxin [Blastocatellia bacterium]